MISILMLMKVKHLMNHASQLIQLGSPIIRIASLIRVSFSITSARTIEITGSGR